MTDMPLFQPNADAKQAHSALKQSIKISDQAQHCAALWFGDIMHRELYRELGFSDMRTYAIEGLNFSPTKAGDFMTLAKRLEDLPVLKEELATGKLGYSVVREIIPVAAPNNEKHWAKAAKNKPRAKLRVDIKQAKEQAKQLRKTNPDQGELIPRPEAKTPAAVVNPRITIEMTPTQYAHYEAQLKALGHRGSKAEILLESIDALVETKTNTCRRVFEEEQDCPPPQTQIHIMTCPKCEEAAIATPQGEVILSPAEKEAATCDAMIHEPGKPNKSTIPPRTRREVLTRDRFKCRRKGCNHTRHLAIHHLKPRANGGTNDKDNLVTLCTKCHILWHEKGGDLREILAENPVSLG